jgi:putative hemolysin
MTIRRNVLTVMMALVVFAGCGSESDADTDTDAPGLANPAAVFCEEQGGVTSGPEPMCELPDGSVVDAWEFYRAEGIDD